MQKTFNIFREEGEPMADSTQINERFSRFHQPQLSDIVKALEVRADLDGITYSEAANHLTAAVSKMPEYQLSQNISGVHSSGGKSGGNSGDGGPHKGGRSIGSIYNYQGKLHT